ncbi:MAG: hypothetical protein EAZ92_11055 [Candidatus Kapaibacterium sp.]|nr:MAG: hypothetical protein EAZ92_11055 [Candidatus Kapabacteria bacterium]
MKNTTHLRYPFLWGIFLIVAPLLHSCGLFSNALNEKSYGVWNIRAGERVFMRDSNGITRSFRTDKDIPAFLYRADDTLFYYSSAWASSKNINKAPLFFAHNEPELRANAVEFDTTYFRDSRFDVDIISIPFRYRFRQGVTLPPSSIASPFCGGIYAGWRVDAALHSVRLLKNETLRNFSTSGFGIGVFTALAPVYVSPWNTDYRTMVEYEGLGLNYGFAIIYAYQSITIGALLGYELLLDENSAIWVYHNRPWLGFSFGLNLN